MSNNKNSIYYLLISSDVVPASQTKTGTIETHGINVIGTGTLFLSEVKPGDFIVDITNTEARKVTTRRDNLYLAIDSPFTSDLAAGTLLKVVRSRAKEVSIANEGAAAATVDGVPLPINSVITLPKSNKNPNGSDFIDPLFVNATGTEVYVLLTK